MTAVDGWMLLGEANQRIRIELKRGELIH